MNIIKATLSSTEKKALKDNYQIRIVIGIVFILPLVLTCLIVGISGIITFFKGNAKVEDVFGLVLSVGVIILFIKLGLPFYKQTFANIRASHKIIIDTYIKEIKKGVIPQVGINYTVFTEANIPLRSMSTSILMHKLGYKDMKVGDRIRIHCLEDNYTDLIFIEQLT